MKDHPELKDLLLRPEERLVSIEKTIIDPPHRPLSPLKALQFLAGVSKPEDIGKNGPLLAARAFPEHRDQQELHLYEVVFGRDSLITSYFLLRQFPRLVRVTLHQLAELQGITRNEDSEEEPGKIVHEARSPEDPIAQQYSAQFGWQWPFYGSVDATPFFILVLANYVNRHEPHFLWEQYTDKAQKQRFFYHALQAAVEWLLQKMRSNPEGLVESLRLNRRGGLANQCWKDSPDGYHHSDGSLADQRQGVASIEVQAYTYDALLDAAELFRSLFSLPRLPADEREQLHFLVGELGTYADRLRAVILHRFWIEDRRGGYFALGSDRDEQGNLRLLQVRASNMGHLLNSRLLDGSDAMLQTKKEALVQTLWAPDLLHNGGIRTLSTQENRFRPTSYHNGSVWPWDTFYISLGLERQGFKRQAQDLRRRLKDVLRVTKRFPEFISGAEGSSPILPTRRIRVLDTRYGFEHFVEQPPQEIQAWTVAAAVAMQDRIRQH